MRSKTVDAAVPKLGLETPSSGGAIPVAAVTTATINFKVEKAGLFRLGHFVNCNHDGSNSLVGLYRQIYIDGVALYGQTSIQAINVPWTIAISSGGRIMRLGVGFHTLSMQMSSGTANIWSIQEGYISVQEL